MIAKGCLPRCVYLSHAKTVEVFERYVEWRYRRGQRRVNFEGEFMTYQAADSLRSYASGLNRAAVLWAGVGAITGRRTFASRLMANGHSFEAVQLLLGRAHLDHAAPYLDVSAQEQREAVRSIELG